jgi:hypothetical protein
MPVIQLADRFGLEADIQPDPSSAFARYFRNLTRFRFSELNAAELRDSSLGNLPVQQLRAGLAVESGAGPAGLEAGASAALAVSREGGQSLLSLSLWARVAAELAGPHFGVEAGGSFAVTNQRSYPPTTAFGEALRGLVCGFAVPGDAADLAAMESGTVSTVDVRGRLKFSATASLANAVNPLASVSLPLPQGLPQIRTGGLVEVGASFELFGDYQVRAEKTAPDRVRLAWRRRAGSDFSLKLSAKAGLLSGGEGGAGALAGQVLGGLLAEPPSGDFLRDTGLSQEQIRQIEGAVRAGVERRLELAAAFEWGALRSDQTAFLFEVDLSALDENGRQALAEALRGELAALLAEPAGIRMIESVSLALRRKRHTFRINLLGIYNVRTVTELARQGKVLFDPETGDLLLSDAVTASRLEMERVNFGAESKKLRKLLAETFLVTAAYRASKLLVEAPELESCHTYFELTAQTSRQDMKDNLDVPQALGLLAAEEKREMLLLAENFGRTTLFAETRYNDSLTTRLFLDEQGQPRDQAVYERAGREAVQLLVERGDPQDFRRRPAIDDELWRSMKSLGQANFRTLFPDRQVEALIAADYSVIVWWAETMRRTAEKLAELHRFFAEHPAPSPDDPEFPRLRQELARHLESVAENTKPQFGDPWGLVAMDRVAGSQAPARVEITGPLLALRLERSGTA